MRPLLKFALRNFLSFTIGMFIVTIIGDYIMGDEVKLLPTFIKSLSFGVFMSIFYTLVQNHSLKDAGVKEITDENLKAFWESKVESISTPDRVINLLKDNKDFKMVASNTNENSINLKTGISLESWGENIEIKFIKNENNLYTYLIKSHPKINIARAEYGTHKRNVDKIISLINA